MGIIFRKNFGNANLEHNVPIKDNSIFRVYSLTKLPIAVAIFQLIEQEKISIKDAIGKYLSNIPESWKTIQIQHLLTHSSGLPKMRSFPIRIANFDVFNSFFHRLFYLRAKFIKITAQLRDFQPSSCMVCMWLRCLWYKLRLFRI